MSRLRLHHVTEFTYESPVTESHNQVVLQPRDDEWQNCMSFRLVTRPATTPTSHVDYFGNRVHRFNVLAPHRSLRIEAQSVVVVSAVPALANDGPLLSSVAALRTELEEAHYDFLAPSRYVPPGPALGPLAAAAEAASDGTAAGFARAAATLVHDRFRYEKGATHVHSSVDDVLAAGAGVCQDFTHLVLGIARLRGLPARYVSGYLIPERTAAEAGEQVSGGLASHAWPEVFVPGAGWLALDPTQGRPVGTDHVRVAYGRDYADVAPVRGVHKGHGGQGLVVDVRVRPAIDDEGHEHVAQARTPMRAAAVVESPQ